MALNILLVTVSLIILVGLQQRQYLKPSEKSMKGVETMELPTTQANKLIVSAHYSWINRIIVGAIPRELAGNTNETILRISEWLNEPTGYANATFKGWTIGVEVQIFYKLNSGISKLDDEIALARLFVKDGWTVEQSKDHIQDPDTHQVSKAFYFAKNLMIKGE